MTVTAAETAAREQAGSGRQARTLLIDVDVHPLFLPRDILPRLPERWRTRYANEHSGRGGRASSATTRAGATAASGSTRRCPAARRAATSTCCGPSCSRSTTPTSRS